MKSTNDLTTQKFWEKYWSSKNLLQKVQKDHEFANIFRQYLTGKNYNTMLEIGGFPGYYAIYFAKYWNYTSTLLDFVVNNQLLIKLLKINDLTHKQVKVIKRDFFKHNVTEKYDLVFSKGFIEHFEDTEDVISRHWQYVSKGGTMIINLPNFTGFNGIYQLIHDPANLNAHNLTSMDMDRLNKAIKNLEPKKYSVFYGGGVLVWLERLNTKSWLTRFTTNFLGLLGLALSKLGIRGRFVSPHIFIIAEK